jgi:class 3 adenylate cyclase
MATLFLEETDAAVVVFDLLRFQQLASTMSPVDIGAALSHFYAHAESLILGHQGRLVKFVGDAVLGTWLAREVQDHKAHAVATVAAAHAGRRAWLAGNIRKGIPELDYTVVATDGPVLAGHIGTDRNKSFDVLGAPVSAAFKLTSVVATRGLDHLLAVTGLEKLQGIATVELEGIELGGNMMRLHRLQDTSV